MSTSIKSMDFKIKGLLNSSRIEGNFQITMAVANQVLIVHFHNSLQNHPLIPRRNVNLQMLHQSLEDKEMHLKQVNLNLDLTKVKNLKRIIEKNCWHRNFTS